MRTFGAQRARAENVTRIMVLDKQKYLYQSTRDKTVTHVLCVRSQSLDGVFTRFCTFRKLKELVCNFSDQMSKDPSFILVL